MSDPGKPPQDEKTVLFDAGDLPNAQPSGPQKAKLVCLDPSKLPDSSKGLEIDLVDREQTIGRGEGNTVQLKATGISKHHARIYPAANGWMIEDLKSTNGVHVNDAKVMETLLKAGDTVKIGKIPFQFVFVRPDIKGIVEKDGKQRQPEFDPDATVSERTMFVGSNLQAAAMLLEAKARQDQADQEAVADTTSPTRPDQVSRGGARGAAPKKGGRWALILVVLILAGGGGGYYWYSTHSGAAKLDDRVQAYTRDLKNFMRNKEESGHPFSAAENAKELTVLSNMDASITDAAREYPDSISLKALEAQVVFLEFERKLRAMIEEKHMDQARPYYDRTMGRFANLSNAINASSGHGQAKSTVSRISGLLDLAGPVITIKTFKQHFPNPSASAANKPTAAELAKAATERRLFAELRKNNNLALSVSFPLFAKIVEEVDDNDVLLLDKWGYIVK